MIVALLMLFACEENADSCDIVQAEWDAELALVQSCEVDEDCAEAFPLPGTSCGNCTRNLVAKDGSDTEQLYYVLQVADDLDCEILPQTECDCPDASGFICDQGACTWDYVE